MTHDHFDIAIVFGAFVLTLAAYFGGRVYGFQDSEALETALAGLVGALIMAARPGGQGKS